MGTKYAEAFEDVLSANANAPVKEEDTSDVGNSESSDGAAD
jgi:hypothetical protein